MIEIARLGTKVVVTLSAGYPISERKFVMEWEAGTEWAASLLCENLKGRFEDNVRHIKKIAYDTGWKESRAHKGSKRQLFSHKFSSAPADL